MTDELTGTPKRGWTRLLELEGSPMSLDPTSVPVVILCGGRGSRFQEETQFRPKPMIEIGERPILWHIMKSYHHYGFRRFILCLGYLGESIRQFFLSYRSRVLNLTVALGSNDIEVHATDGLPELDPESGWVVSLIDTGSDAMTGARVKRIEQWIDTEHFALTYGDGLTDVDLARALDHHGAHGRVGTVTGVRPPGRFGELVLSGDPVGDAATPVTEFSEKPQTRVGSINGGFFFFQRRFFDYLSEDSRCVLEKEPLERLAADGQLMAVRHDGFWQCMDTQRDRDYLESLWREGRAPWRVWE